MPTPGGKRIGFVAAIGEGRELGLRGGSKGMPWDIPEELEHFHTLTRGHVVIMGRRTYDVIGRPLGGRVNIVLTRNPAYDAEGVIVAHTLDDGLRIADRIAPVAAGADEIMIIGGGQVFEQALAVADRLYLTLVRGRYPADVFFPDLSRVHDRRGP